MERGSRRARGRRYQKSRSKLVFFVGAISLIAIIAFSINIFANPNPRRSETLKVNKLQSSKKLKRPGKTNEGAQETSQTSFNKKNRSSIDMSLYLGKAIKRSATPTNKVALTLDDGPSDLTLEAVKILEKYNARATFFFVGERIEYGWAKGPRPERFEILKKVHESGSEIANHAYLHLDFVNLTSDTVMSRISKTDDLVLKYTGNKPLFVRPPAGHYDQTALDVIKSTNHLLALWSVHSQDTHDNSSQAVASNVISSTQGGDIVLMHETKIKTIEALPKIIEALQAKGYELVTLSELLSS